MIFSNRQRSGNGRRGNLKGVQVQRQDHQLDSDAPFLGNSAAVISLLMFFTAMATRRERVDIPLRL